MNEGMQEACVKVQCSLCFKLSFDTVFKEDLTDQNIQQLVLQGDPAYIVTISLLCHG